LQKFNKKIRKTFFDVVNPVYAKAEIIHFNVHVMLTKKIICVNFFSAVTQHNFFLSRVPCEDPHPYFKRSSFRCDHRFISRFFIRHWGCPLSHFL